MHDLSTLSIVLPSLDPDEKLAAVIDGLLEVGFSHIILVNDGSKPENLHYFEAAAAAHPQITLLHHPVNRGKGAALKTAFSWFLEHRPQGFGVVTVDGDNQHHKLDTKACALHLLETGKLTLGVRDFSQPDVPARSRFGNRVTSGVFKFFVGMTISDTQTGLRAISREDLKVLLTIPGERFEYETNMLLALKEHGIPFEEVKIRTVYIEENKSSHFRVIADSWRIYKLILVHFFRYTLVSLISAVLDEFLFQIFSALLWGPLTGFAYTAFCTIGARTLSSLFNFFMNKRVVFRCGVSTGKAMLRYYMLAIPQMLAQMTLTHILLTVLGIGSSSPFLRGLVYGVVMVFLFLVSFFVQQHWVFHQDHSKEKE